MQNPEYTLEKPDTSRDAPFFAAWPVVAGESVELAELIDREQQEEVTAWAIRIADKTIGAVWIELLETDYLDAPSVHYLVGDPEYGESGVRDAAIKDMLRYSYAQLPYAVMYARHMATDKATENALRKLGFEPDAKPYVDDAGQRWQNVRVVL